MNYVTDYISDKIIYNHAIYTDDHPDTSHIHSVPELLFIISGDAYHVTEGKKYRLKKYDLVLVKPNVTHYIETHLSRPYERYDIFFNPDILDDIDCMEILDKFDVINCSQEYVLLDIMKKFDYYHMNFELNRLGGLYTLLIKELFYNLSIITPPQNPSFESFSPVLINALEYINANLFTIRSISEICNALYITEGYLFKLFGSCLKTTPKKYITEKRLLSARKAIALGKKPTEIYSDLGFSDYTAFYRNYVKLFGHPPSATHDLLSRHTYNL